MPPDVLIYSSDNVRGRIVDKALVHNDFRTKLVKNAFDVESETLGSDPPVILLDAKNNVPRVLNLCKSLSLVKPDTPCLILSCTQEAPAFDALDKSNIFLSQDPIDPEYILFRIRSIVDADRSLPGAWDANRSGGLPSASWDEAHHPVPTIPMPANETGVPGVLPELMTLTMKKPGTPVSEIQGSREGAGESSESGKDDSGEIAPKDAARAGGMEANTGQDHETIAKKSGHPAAKGRLGSRAFWMVARFLVIFVIGITSGYGFWCAATMPPLENLNEYAPFEASGFYSHDNQLLSEFYIERRKLVPFDQIPEHVRLAFVTTEDARFYEHSGIDVIRLAGSLYKDLKTASYMEGGSTITQQLVKMTFLGPEKTITRKIQEAIFALKIEKQYTKDEILQHYLNKAYFGSRAYGIEAAAQSYFNKPVSDLNTAQAAMLAGMLKAPSTYSPYKNPQKCLQRRNMVLGTMLAAQVIDNETYERSLAEPLPVQMYGRKNRAPYFVDFCRTKLESKYGQRLYTSGLSVYTTLDYAMQLAAEEAVKKGAARLNERVAPGIQTALVAVELDTGRILAMTGGNNFWKTQFNRATQAMRQPGSSFKPFVYLTALKQGLNPEDTIQDVITTHRVEDSRNQWTPKNYGNKYHGTVSLTQALAKSLNAATVNLSMELGIDNIIETARALGIRSKIYPVYPSVLGASETTLLEMVYAYAALATGYRMEPFYIDRIIDRERHHVLEPVAEKNRVIPDDYLAGIRKMLRTVILEGTGVRARDIGRPVYGKTGTTNKNVDALFIGFDDYLSVGVWVGRDDRKPIGKSETGASAALPIWLDFMSAVNSNGANAYSRSVIIPSDS